MSTIIVNSIILNGEAMGVFTLQEEGGSLRTFSRKFGVKTLENMDTNTVEPIVQIVWHDANEVFATAVSSWVVNGQPFTDAGTLCAVLEDVVSEPRLITGDEVTAATVNGDLVAKDDTTLVFTDIARQSVLSSVSQQVLQNTSDIEGIQQDLAGKEHFRGYYATTVEVQALANPSPGDYAYNAETGTKWAYGGTVWEDTLTPVPDQTVEPSDATPLMDGAAGMGAENRYARGDHRHPTDSSRASQADMTAVQQTLQGTITGATIAGAAVGVLNKVLQLPAYPTALPASGGDADTLDGKHAADFVPRNLVFENSGNVDPNTTTYPRILALHANCPTRVNDADYWYIDTTFYTNAEKSQLARPYLDPSKGLYYRACYENVWTAWQKINDGGNADTLDGKHANYFPQTIEITDWNSVTCKAGDTLLGSYTSLNGPSGQYFVATALNLNDDPSYQTVLGVDAGGTVWKRRQNGGVWGEWINAADGGNADKLNIPILQNGTDIFTWASQQGGQKSTKAICENAANAPTNGRCIYTVDWDIATGGYILLAERVDYGAPVIYFNRWYDTWSGWKNIADGGNADTLDGRHASDFAGTGLRIPGGSDLLTYFSDKSSGFYSAVDNASLLNGIPNEAGTFSYDVNVLNSLSCTIIAKSYSTGRTYYATVSGNSLMNGGWKFIADGGNAATVGGVAVDNMLTLRGVLTSNVNANTLVSTGIYILTLGNGTGNTNFPAGVGYGNMLIYGNPTFMTQLITTHSDGVMWYRVCYDTANPNFTAWKKVVTAEANGDIIAFKTI